jgi:hypothetical protein
VIIEVMNNGVYKGQNQGLSFGLRPKATPFFDLPIVLNFGDFFFVWCCRKDS